MRISQILSIGAVLVVLVVLSVPSVENYRNQQESIQWDKALSPYIQKNAQRDLDLSVQENRDIVVY